MTNFERYVKTKEIEYKNFSVKKEIDINRFLSNFLIVEKMGQKDLINFEHNEAIYRKDDYYWFMYNQKILENKIIEEKGYSTLFLTLTLDSPFHRFKTIKYKTTKNSKFFDEKCVKKYNPKFNEENTIENGYKLLNSTFRDIYKNFRVNRKFVKVYYSKVFEPHKNFTPHLHAILYVKEEFKENLIQHIKNMIKKNSLGKSFEIEEIKDLSRSSSYLLKYIRKNTNVEDCEKFRVFNGWKKTHKIRIFTCSILTGLERFLYKKIKNNTSITRDLKENPIIKILNECNIKITTKCKTTKEVKIKNHIVESPKYSIEVKKERIQTKDKKELDLVKDYIDYLKNDFWKCAKRNDWNNCFLNTGKFDLFTFNRFETNKKFLKVVNEFYVKNFLDSNKFNFKTFFDEFYNFLFKYVKNVSSYRVIDLKIFEHNETTIIKKYDKEEFYITNTTKKENRLKRVIWEIKDENYKK